MDPNEKSGEIRMVPPYEASIGERVKGRYGYKDARVEVDIVVPPPFSVIKKKLTLKLTAEEADQLYEALGKIKIWNQLPDYQRARDGAE